MNTYCSFARSQPKNNLHRIHHDTEHGRYPKSDDDLFKRFNLEIMQAGLSFTVALSKKKKTYELFGSIKRTAQYKQQDIQKFLEDKEIVRNKIKIQSIIFNAKKILELQKEHGSFKSWLDKHQNNDLNQWISLFKKNFKFTGKEIVNEFLMSTRYLKGAHDKNCEIEKKIIEKHL